MASSNPFRRKSTILTAPIQTAELDESRFPALQDIDASVATPPPQTSFRNGQIPDAPFADEKTKPVKQVRILSPPPVSPDSSGWSFTAQPLVGDGGQRREDPDPFEGASTDDSDREIVAGNPPTQNSGRVPPNPFNRTLKDVESVEGEQHLKKERRGEAAALKAGNISRRSLDVNAFKRLLMTGDSGSGSGSSGSPTPPRAHQLRFGHQRSATESFSASPAPSYSGSKDSRRSETGLHETSLISNEISETPSEEAEDGSISDSSASLHLSREKKPPPPPSSRHGKSIRLELGEDSDALQRPRSKSPSDMNKPLPPAPVRKSLDDAESPFDRESAGKVPEVDIPVISQSTWGSGKKAVPVPPPRRGHARAESKANAAMSPSGGQIISRSFEDEAPRRTSMDSVRSRSERSRHEGQAAPLPPPRRTTGSRQSSHILSPIPSTLDEPSSTPSTPQILTDKAPFASPLPHTTSLDQSTFRETHSGTPKLYAPPPPPTRNPSVRRPASVRSIDSTSRRISAEVKPHNSMAPPPPPRRQRGNSRGSQDGQQQQQQPRRTSFDNYSAAPTLNEDNEEPTPDLTQDGVGVSDPAVSTSPQSADVTGKGADILADLDALQREVDALRGRFK